MKIDAFCQKLEDRLASRPRGEGRIEAIAQSVHKAFQVQPDEVAIFMLDNQADTLCFLWPTRLKSSGFIPLTSRDSLAARTANEKRSFLNNRFNSAQHASIFEAVRLDDQQQHPLPIQKIISAPLVISDAIKGVIQVCRKGPEPHQSGVNFSQSELDALTAIAKVIARFI